MRRLIRALPALAMLGYVVGYATGCCCCGPGGGSFDPETTVMQWRNEAREVPPLPPRVDVAPLPIAH